MMCRSRRILIATLLSWTAVAVCGDRLPPIEWRCTALTPRHLALTGDCSRLQLQLFRERLAIRRQTMRRSASESERDICLELSGIEAIAAYRPQLARLLRDSPTVTVVAERGDIAVTASGYWLSPIGQARFPDESGRERLSLSADAAHHLFLTLSRPLADGEKVTITLPDGEKIAFAYRAGVPTPVFRINQVGYLPGVRKFAYLGAWLGNGGALPLLREFTGKPFRLIDDETGKTAHTGLLHPRPHDQHSADGTPFTGEETLEIDLSAFSGAGRYHLEVEGIGRSESFRIGPDTMAEAFYIHARGLYHRRCGVAKEKPYTDWTSPGCHTECLRGVFPPDPEHYSKSDAKRPYGFRDALGRRKEVAPARLIAQNRPSAPEILHHPGGWHDAADWERRPQHLHIVGDLSAVYLMKPGNFCDGQLNLPESGNGIPDLLDEACWGIDHLRLKQQSDGGVGTWIATTRHPRPEDGGPAEDRQTYYLSCATRNSTIAYAAYAAELALALKRAGAEKRAELYRDSAQRAWKYALDPAKRVVRTFLYDGEIIFYREPPEPDPVYLVKAGFDLFQLSGDRNFLLAAERTAPAALADLQKDERRHSPLIWIELELFPCPSAKLKRIRQEHRKSLLSQARTMLLQLESNYPIRAPWPGAHETGSREMGGGAFHPLRQARLLIVAHAMTGERLFRDGACLANDFNNGANPFGSSMTSGLGRVYPVRFFDLSDCSGGSAEPAPGITPYRNTYDIPRDAVRMAFGLFYRPDRVRKFEGLSQSLLPWEGLSEAECAKKLGVLYPIWHRWGNVESRTAAASGYSLWETIAPAAVVTGYLLNGGRLPRREWLERRPAADIRKLPGYAPLP